MDREILKSYFDAIRLTLIKHNMFELSLSNEVLARSGAKSIHSMLNGSKEVTSIIASVNSDRGKY